MASGSHSDGTNRNERAAHTLQKQCRTVKGHVLVGEEMDAAWSSWNSYPECFCECVLGASDIGFVMNKNGTWF